jgi:hypothetical protein
MKGTPFVKTTVLLAVEQRRYPLLAGAIAVALGATLGADVPAARPAEAASHATARAAWSTTG